MQTNETTHSTEAEKIVVVREQERYKQDKAGSLSLLFLFILGLGVSLLFVNYLFRIAANPAPVYFPATAVGQLIQEQPLDTPGLGTNVLLNWVAESLMSMNTMNFVNTQTVMNAAQTYFAPEGYQGYQNAMAQSKIVDGVISNKLVLSAIPTDAPQILAEKPFAGRYMWKIKMPMRFRYQSVKSDLYDAVDITIVVMRVPTSQSPIGVTILKYDIEIKPRGAQ